MDVKLIVTGGSKQSRVIPLRSEETIVGRQRGCDLRIPSPLVSRRHCRLSFRDGCLILEDLASANGSLLNGVAVKGQEMVYPGDHLTIGPVTFRVEYQLTPVTMDNMLEENLPASDADDVIPLVEEEPPEPKQGKKTVAQDRPAKPKPDEPKTEVAADADVQVNFEDLGWQPPAGEDLRDLLSRLEDE
jgi:pSer/pThr/pTyr-binding forkhead associated (FHA) protein